MITDEAQVRLAARLYEARDAVRRLLGDGFDDRMALLKRGIKKRMQDRGLEIMPAAFSLVSETECSPALGIQVLAAAVELIENNW